MLFAPPEVFMSDFNSNYFESSFPTATDAVPVRLSITSTHFTPEPPSLPANSSMFRDLPLGFKLTDPESDDSFADDDVRPDMLSGSGLDDETESSFFFFDNEGEFVFASESDSREISSETASSELSESQSLSAKSSSQSTDERFTQTFTTSAYFISSSVGFSLVYDESPGQRATISVDADREIVTIARMGGLLSTIVLEEGKRHISVYKTPFMNFEAAAYARRICIEYDTLSPSASISLDYLIELRGAELQRTIMKIEASPFSRNVAII